MVKEELRRYSVTRPGITCCAKDCPFIEHAEKFFFTFPSCDLSNWKSIERCRTWVKKVGNLDLLKVESSKLAGNFFICCSHFPDWTAVDSSTRYITNDAVPIYFDCPPLSNEEMECFPVYEVSKQLENNTQTETDPPLSKTDDVEGGCETISGETVTNDDCSKKQSKPTLMVDSKDGDPSENEKEPVIDDDTTSKPEGPATAMSALSNLLSLEKEKDSKEEEQDSNCAGPKSQGSEFNETEKKSQKTCTGERKRLSRKAKLYAFNKISNQEKEDLGTKGIMSNSSAQKTKPKRLSNDMDFNDVPMPKLTRVSLEDSEVEKKSPQARVFTSFDEPERFSARSSIVFKDIVSKLGTKSNLPSLRQANDAWKNKKTKNKDSNDETCNNVKIIRVGNLAMRDNIGNEGKLKSPEHSNTPNLSSHSSDSSLSTPFIYSNSIAIQTDSETLNAPRNMMKILNSDRKLKVFSGLPSYDVLNSITDATLHLVMNNRAAISDIEPTLKEWIVLTCTKFMLNLSLEVVSIMFEVTEEDCQRIINKTCLFLRKTLSLKDCQKYLWQLPSHLLDGIADCSDKVLQEDH